MHLKTSKTTRLATLAAICASAFAPAAAVGAAQTPSSGAIADHGAGQAHIAQVPVSFRVRNVNRSAVACASDGRTYTVRGHLVGPVDKLRSKRIGAATMYLHGLSFGEFFWSFRQARGYDYAAEQAHHGQVSVVIDRLGYGASDKPDGTQVCAGSRADMTHQIVQQLRRRDYRAVPAGRGPQIKRVYLAGHSYGAQIAQVEAYSFGDIAGLMVIGYSDRVQSPVLKANAAYAADVCATGGLRVGGAGPTGYAPFGPPTGAAAALFDSALPRVQLAALQLLTIDPCGDTASFALATEVDLTKVSDIKVPVLVVAGGTDALFPKPAGPDQASLYTSSKDVTQVTLPNTGHAFTLERSHQRFATVIRRWLERQGR